MDISQSSKQFELEKEDVFQRRLEDFYRKPVSIEVAMKRGLLGFVDFRNEDFLKTSIESSDQKKVVLEFGREILLSDICKIEERSD
ncbi:hypothetical protein [Facklamia miroungae]|uniref:hypothetical protein n=1 Tax=Facklamia miroungae TaxID=120956 RepID=UPI000B7CDCFB|nr:hypothetical protein [Facklamia miroungae]NKZ30021.1 hypothetical protein [Facklamia miroungae]